MYTIIGEEFVYYLTDSGVEGEISLGVFLEVLTRNAMNLGKAGKFEFVNINEQDAIWILNGPTMNAMWNIILMLYNNIEKSKREDESHNRASLSPPPSTQ